MPNNKNRLSDDVLDNVTGGAIAGPTDPTDQQDYTCANCGARHSLDRYPLGFFEGINLQRGGGIACYRCPDCGYEWTL